MKIKTFQALLLMIAGIFILGLFTAWWLPPLWVILIAMLMKLDTKTGILTGGLSYTLVLVATGAYMDARDNADIISKTGMLMIGYSHWMMLFVLLVLSFITGALSGWLGSALGIFFHQKQVEKRSGQRSI